MYDLARGEWKKSGATVNTCEDSNQVFIGYAPTLGRVSGMTAEQRHTPEVLAFIGLQQLIGDGGFMYTYLGCIKPLIKFKNNIEI